MTVHERNTLVLDIGHDVTGAHRDLHQFEGHGRRVDEATHCKVRDVERLGERSQILLLPVTKFRNGFGLQSVLTIDAVKPKAREILIHHKALLLLRLGQYQRMKVHGTSFLVASIHMARRPEPVRIVVMECSAEKTQSGLTPFLPTDNHWIPKQRLCSSRNDVVPIAGLIAARIRGHIASRRDQMNLTRLAKVRPSSTLTRGHSLIHAEYPIEQTLHSDDAETQGVLMQRPWSREKWPDGTLYLADYSGLRLLGRSEGALGDAVGPLRRRFAERLVVDPPSVRYAFGPPTLEPYMKVLVNGPERYMKVIRRDFLRRRGRINRLDQCGAFVLDGEAPLADLLGYRQWVSDLTGEVPCVGLWLSRYVPIDDEGPRAA
jgi:hypothetical protein